GGNLPENRPQDLALETNPEVLAVNQKGINSRQLYRKDGMIVWVSQMSDKHTRNVAFFNLNDSAKKMGIKFSKLGIQRKVTVRDLWERKNVGEYEETYNVSVAPHGAKLIQIY